MRWKTLRYPKPITLSRQLNPFKQKGLSLVELMAAITISTLIIAGLGGVVSQALETERVVRENNDVQQQARFAMQQMVQAISRSQRLMLPLAENPNTVWSESVRDPGVLAVTMDPTLDRNKDGFADADNDKDGLIDEDLGNDTSNDSSTGITNIDDDGDGISDNGSNFKDDDEDGSFNEDPINGIDDDNDGAIDEDSDDDMNQDNKAGIAGIDDDSDGTIDEGNKKDDDEDGSNDEDWYDPVVFYLSGTTLLQRFPNINPSDGTDYTEYTIAENVTQFRVERIAQGTNRSVLVEVSLTLSNADGESSQLKTSVRVGGGL